MSKAKEDAVQDEPLTQGEVVQAEAVKQHADRARPGPKIPLPNGARASASAYIGMAYQGFDFTQMLGNPESILLKPRPGHMYVWKKRSDRQTAAWVRAGILRPVSPDEVDSRNPAAEYTDEASVTGESFVSWESLTLFEMPPKWIKRIYTAPQEWALTRLAQQQEDFASKVETATAGAYRGSSTITGKGSQ